MHKVLNFSCAIVPFFHTGFPQDQLLLTKKQMVNYFNIELATTPIQQYLGLSYRRFLPIDNGMLFVFSTEQMLHFCMRNCFINLDIAFIDSDMRIVNMFTMPVEPFGKEKKIYRSEKLAKFALEVNGGEFKKKGVKVGDLIILSNDIKLILRDLN
jgi:uncharacterized membrane protein (UPF0127 family)